MRTHRLSGRDGAIGLLAAALAGGLVALELGAVNGWLEAGLTRTWVRYWLPAAIVLAFPAVLLRVTRGPWRLLVLAGTYLATIAGIVLWRLLRFGGGVESLFWGEEAVWVGMDDAAWSLLGAGTLVVASVVASWGRHRAWLLAAGAWGGILALHFALGQTPRNATNVLLITVDTVRADLLSLYGYEQPTSPILEAAAERGLVFDAYYSQSSWTAPTIASIVTGLPIGVHGVTEERTLASSFVTAAEYLREAGYETALVSANDIVGPLFGLGQGYEVYVPFAEDEDRAAEALSAAVTQLLSRWRERPFFIHAHYMDPHEDYAPPSPWRDRFMAPGDPPPRHPSIRMGEATEEIAARARDGRLSKSDLDWLRALYKGELAYVDAQIGSVLSALDELELTEHTLVLIAGDHGESFGERGLLLHGRNLHREQVHSLLAILAPGGRVGRVRAATQSLDLFYTILKAADVEPLAHFGDDLRSDLDQTKRVIRQRVARQRLDDLAAVIVGRFKLVVPADAELQLFDIEADPFERNDLAGEPGHAQLLRELYAKRGRVADRFGLHLSPSTQQMRSRELRALGYIK